MSLQLERLQQRLEREQMAHQATQMTLKNLQHKNEAYANQIEKLMHDKEIQQDEHSRQVDRLQQELAQSQERLQMADEDAQVALELAQANNDRREQAEEWLTVALEENEQLKGSARPRHVRFADEVAESLESIPETPSSTRPSRGLVAAGRMLLQRSLSSDEDAHVVDKETLSSAERRRQLRAQFQSLSIDVPSPAKSPARQEDPAISRTVSKILCESGRKLQLSGRWKNDNEAACRDVEALTKEYCAAVEIQLERKNKEVIELESLCTLWEAKASTEGVADNV